MTEKLTGTGRDMLIMMVTELRAEVATLTASLKNRDAGIRDLQAQLTSYAKGLTIRGWFCPVCRVFCGEEKETLTVCRSCGIEKGGMRPAQIIASDLDELDPCTCAEHPNELCPRTMRGDR